MAGPFTCPPQTPAPVAAPTFATAPDTAAIAAKQRTTRKTKTVSAQRYNTVAPYCAVLRQTHLTCIGSSCVSTVCKGKPYFVCHVARPCVLQQYEIC